MTKQSLSESINKLADAKNEREGLDQAVRRLNSENSHIAEKLDCAQRLG